MGTPVTNFGKVTVSTGYSAAAVSIDLTAGHGSRLPSTFPFPLIWWDSTTYGDPADDPNREIVSVTGRTGDTLTVTRGAESTSASNKNTAGKTYKMVLGITKAMWDSIFSQSLTQSFRGLTVRTHPSNDLAQKQVIFSADAIVMDDGEEISSWSNIVADVTVSGAGGLDTGSEGASRWYELYAIYNPTTSTKNGLLHRAKDYAAGTTYVSGEDGSHALRDATARTKLNQGFQVSIAGPCPWVDVKLAKQGSPTGNIWFTIEGNSGGVPDGVPLATSRKINVALFSTTFYWRRIMFDTPATLSASTQYHLVMQGDFTVSGVNYMQWKADTTAASYANGSKAAYDGATWTNDTDDDFQFTVYITQNDTAVTMPSGYTQKALIGFVFNTSGSNFMRFVQKQNKASLLLDNETATSATNYMGSTATTGTTFILSTLIPPRPCWVWFGVDQSTSGINHIMANLYAETTLTATDPTGEILSYNTQNAGAGALPGTNTQALFMESDGIIVAVAANTDYYWVLGFEW